MSDIVTIITALIAALGGGVLSTIMLRKPMLKKASEEAKSVEQNNAMQVAEGWRTLAEERQQINEQTYARNKEKDEQITQLYVSIGEWRDKYNEKCEELSNSKVELAMQKPKICLVKGCEHREPQSGY